MGKSLYSQAPPVQENPQLPLQSKGRLIKEMSVLEQTPLRKQYTFNPMNIK